MLAVVTLAADLACAFSEALAAIDLEALTAAALARARFSPGALLAAGKAAPAMARGAARSLGGVPARSLVVVPRGLAADVPGARVVRAAHPVPDAASVRAGELALALAARKEPLLVLLSGGASALLTVPFESLARERAVTRALLASGASIEEINVVRRHASGTKGGRLAVAAHPAPVLTLVVSDVVRGHVWDVASGPTAPDPTSVRDARAALRRHAPELVDLRLRETPKPGDRRLRHSRVRVVASPRDVASLVGRALLGRGFAVRVGAPAVGDVAALAKRYLREARRLAPGEVIVRSAEPTVVVTGSAGRGGRSTHLAALVGPHLPPGVALLAGATDGVDGASGTGGAVASRGAFRRASERAVLAALGRFDTGALCEGLGVALAGGPTGHNFADVHVLARGR